MECVIPPGSKTPSKGASMHGSRALCSCFWAPKGQHQAHRLRPICASPEGLRSPQDRKELRNALDPYTDAPLLRTRPVGMRSSRMMGMRIVGMRMVGMRMVGMRSSSRPRSRMKAPASSRAWRSTTTAGARNAAFSQRTPVGPAQSWLVVASIGVRAPS